MTSPFLQNKYSRWYFAIVKHRSEVTVSGYGEKHHVIPRSMGGTNDALNIVKLTAREHFVCHWLLIKMTSGSARAKMYSALWFMANKGHMKRSARAYEALRVHFSTDPNVRKMKSQATTKGWKRAEVRQNHAIAEASPKTRARKRAAAIEANNRPDVIAKREMRWADPQFQDAHSKLTKEAMANPDVKQRMYVANASANVKERKSQAQKIAQNKPTTVAKRKASVKKFFQSMTFEERCAASNTNKPVHQIDPLTGEIIMTYQSAAEAARQTGIKKVKDVARGARPRAGGYYWQYVGVNP